MTPAERTAKIAQLRAEADRPKKEGERNWPERVEAGMCFGEDTGSENVWIATVPKHFVCILGSCTGMIRATPIDDWIYLGLACNVLTIKTPDAPEPTGAELVGEVCEFSDNSVAWAGRNTVLEFRPDLGYRWAIQWYRFARLAKEQP